MDYAFISETGSPLKGVPIAADWDAGLAETMREVGKCVHEENILNALLLDLGRSS